MNKALIRPLILLLVFFLGLYVLREPLRNMNSNFSLLKYHYIDPVIAYVKGDKKDGDVFDQISNDLNNVDSLPSSTNNSTSSSRSPSSINNNQNNRAQDAIISKGDLLADSSKLSIAGVLAFTNKERTSRQLQALKNDAELNRSAEIKLQDMFTKQYFQHVSPSGVGVSELVREAGYEYIVVGENLALGNFGGDYQVVTAWMNSPGHRANILDTRYQEIGIAVGKGLYNGRMQWIAVQHFGKPLSSCDGPSVVLKDKIAVHTNELSVLELELASQKKEIESSTERGQGQEDRINTYNDLVVNYNTRLEGLKDEINTYNTQVRTFNACAGLTK